ACSSRRCRLLGFLFGALHLLDESRFQLLAARPGALVLFLGVVAVTALVGRHPVREAGLALGPLGELLVVGLDVELRAKLLFQGQLLGLALGGALGFRLGGLLLTVEGFRHDLLLVLLGCAL